MPTLKVDARPLELIVATEGLLEDQAVGLANAAPYWSSVVAVNCVVDPTMTVLLLGEIETEFKAGSNRKFATMLWSAVIFVKV